VRWRRVRTEKQFWDQAETYNISDVARLMLAAIIDPTPGYFKGVTGETPVTAKKAAGALPEIGNNNDIGLVIAPCRL